MNAVDISVTSGHLVTNPSMNTIRNTYISVFLALYVVHCTASEQLASLASCSRQQSKIARNVLHEYVFPHMARTEAPTLDKCLFHPNNDMLLKHEQHKQPLAHDHWRCGFCGKAFQTEAHLERHMTVHHADEVHPVGRHCLADYCDILHCDHFQARWNGQWPSPVDDGSCNVAQMQHVYGKCMEVATRCFGGFNGKQRKTYEWFTKHFCGAATCDYAKQRVLLRDVTKMHKPQRYGWVIAGVLFLVVILGAYAMLWTRVAAQLQQRVMGTYGGSRGGWIAKLVAWVEGEDKAA